MPVFPTLEPIADKPLSVVLLAHDDAAHVEPVLTGWSEFLDARPGEHELILIDGSTDGTAEKAEALKERLPRLHVLRQGEPHGEGRALRLGLEAASRPLVFYTLCRPEYQPADLGRMLDRPAAPGSTGKEIDHVHLLSGYRAGQPVPAAWRLVGRLWWLVCLLVAHTPHRLPGWLGWRRHLGWAATRVVFGLRHQDVACPFRLMRREVLARIPIQSRGPFAHVELLAKANFLGHLMSEEMPIDVVPPATHADLRQVWRDAWLVFDHPDFGPAVLPAETTGPKPETVQDVSVQNAVQIAQTPPGPVP
jgi:glycosyltransferase involved in cell wall biosynthesis